MSACVRVCERDMLRSRGEIMCEREGVWDKERERERVV